MATRDATYEHYQHGLILDLDISAAIIINIVRQEKYMRKSKTKHSSNSKKRFGAVVVHNLVKSQNVFARRWKLSMRKTAGSYRGQVRDTQNLKLISRQLQ